MLTLDKIKIIAPVECITILNQGMLESRMKNGTLVSLSYTQTKPYMLYVEVNYKSNEAIVEFSGKILLDSYPELININNIKDCFNRINGIGFCQIDVEMIRKYGRVCVVDITKDIQYTDVFSLSEWLRTHIINHRKYLARNISGNLIIEKNVKTKAYKRRLVVYDKGKELHRAENQEFISSLTDPDGLLSYFNGRIRFEYNLNSCQSIRQVLNISDTTIDNILNSNESPIKDFLNEVVAEDTEADSVCLSWTDRKNLAVLRDCEMDLAKVAAEIRTYASQGSHLSQMIKPYRELLSRLGGKSSRGFKTKLLGLLLETTIIFPLILLL